MYSGSSYHLSLRLLTPNPISEHLQSMCGSRVGPAPQLLTALSSVPAPSGFRRGLRKLSFHKDSLAQSPATWALHGWVQVPELLPAGRPG